MQARHLHCHSKNLQGDPGGFGLQNLSSEPSPQSSSESHLQVLSTHFLLSHLNSFGSQPLEPGHNATVYKAAS